MWLLLLLWLFPIATLSETHQEVEEWIKEMTERTTIQQNISLPTQEIKPVNFGRLTAIYPGTKWCGPGRSAVAYNDLGTLYREDLCCRDHDICSQDFIAPNSRKYGLYNPSASYRFACKCEARLYICLKAVKSPAANIMGNIYFNMAGEDCFKRAYPITGCRYSIRNRIERRCLGYRTDKTQPKQFQFFDVPPY